MSNSDFEQKSIIQKVKEYSTLIISVFIILMVSIAVMDIIVLPLSVFAIENSDLYTSFFKKAVLLLIAFYIILKTAGTFLSYYKNRLKFDEILIITIKSKLSAIVKILFFIIIAACFIVLIKFLLEYNYYQIYKFLK